MLPASYPYHPGRDYKFTYIWPIKFMHISNMTKVFRKNGEEANTSMALMMNPDWHYLSSTTDDEPRLMLPVITTTSTESLHKCTQQRTEVITWVYQSCCCEWHGQWSTFVPDWRLVVQLHDVLHVAAFPAFNQPVVLLHRTINNAIVLDDTSLTAFLSDNLGKSAPERLNQTRF